MIVKPTGNMPPMLATTGQTSSQQEARERAIAKLTSSPGQADSPINQNNVTPEDFSAVVAQSKQAESTSAETSAKSDDVETQATETPEVKEDSYSTKLAALARREKALRAEAQRRETAFKMKEAEIAKREQELTGRQSQYDTDYIPKSRLKEATFQALAEAGVDPTLFADQMKNLYENPVDPRVNQEINTLKATIAKLEAANEASRKASEQASQDQYQAAVRQITTDVNTLVKTDPAYEAIRTTRSQKDVVELIEETFKSEGRLMSVEEAAQEVEDYLSEQLSEYATKINKIRARFEPKNPVKQEAQPEQQAQPKQPQMRTLTNDKGTTRRLSARERAIAVMEGKKVD